MTNPNTTAVVTGASSGIGRALAVHLAARGVRVGITARRADLLAELVTQVRSTGGTIAVAPADVADRPALAAAIRSLTDTLGPIDLLIANAGMGRDTGADPMNVPAVEEVLRVNFLGVVYAFEAVMESMLTRRTGHLVAISSLAAFKGLPGVAAYCASKAAVNAYLESLRIELRPRGVAVTAVCPGFVDTPLTQRHERKLPFLLTPDAAAKRILAALPRKPAVYSFPWPMKILMKSTAWAPDWLMARTIPKRPANPQ